MKPETTHRRTIIREWMSLPQPERETAEQAAAFADRALRAHALRGPGNRHQRVLTWLRPRIGRD